MGRGRLFIASVASFEAKTTTTPCWGCLFDKNNMDPRKVVPQNNIILWWVLGFNVILWSISPQHRDREAQMLDGVSGFPRKVLHKAHVMGLGCLPVGPFTRLQRVQLVLTPVYSKLLSFTSWTYGIPESPSGDVRLSWMHAFAWVGHLVVGSRALPHKMKD